MTTKSQSAADTATLKIAQDVLADALNTVCPVIENKTTIPVLANVLIESIGENRLRFTGTDLDITTIHEVEADYVPEKFVACLNARKLRDIAVLLEGEMVELTPEENFWIRLTDGKAHYRLPGVSEGNFAARPEVTGPAIEIPFDVLKRAIGLTGFTITKEQSRFTLSGAKFELGDNKLRVITTDGHRLSFVEVELVQSNKVDVLIPKKALDQVTKLKAGTSRGRAATVGSVRIVPSQNRLDLGPRSRELLKDQRNASRHPECGVVVMNPVLETALKRRRYPGMAKARKQWPCDRCARLIELGEEYEHSFAVPADEKNHILAADVRLCRNCSTEI